MGASGIAGWMRRSFYWFVDLVVGWQIREDGRTIEFNDHDRNGIEGGWMMSGLLFIVVVVVCIDVVELT